MKICPKCSTKSLSEVRLALQQLSVPGVICECPNCGEWVSYKSKDSVIIYMLTELIFIACLILSVIYFFNVWVGVFAFIVFRVCRFYFITRGELELPNEDI